MRRQCGVLARLAELDVHEQNSQDSRESKQQRDAEVGPPVGDAAPLKGEQETDDGADENRCSGNVEEGELLPPGQL